MEAAEIKPPPSNQEDGKMRKIPKKYVPMYEKAMNRKSRKAAIRSFCLECVSYSEQEVKNCTDPACPLFLYRLSG